MGWFSCANANKQLHNAINKVSKVRFGFRSAATSPLPLLLVVSSVCVSPGRVRKHSAPTICLSSALIG